MKSCCVWYYRNHPLQLIIGTFTPLTYSVPPGVLEQSVEHCGWTSSQITQGLQHHMIICSLPVWPVTDLLLYKSATILTSGKEEEFCQFAAKVTEICKLQSLQLGFWFGWRKMIVLSDPFLFLRFQRLLTGWSTLNHTHMNMHAQIYNLKF